MVLGILPVQGLPTLGGALVRVAQWDKPWPTDLADRVRSPLEVDSSLP